MYASDWIFGLFASVIPLEKMKIFFNIFFKRKWVFFYQMILSILRNLEQAILQEEELWEILNAIKSTTASSSSANHGYYASPDRKGDL
jgi:hypothetical protein